MRDMPDTRHRSSAPHAPAPNPLLEARGLSYRSGASGAPLLNDITLALPRGATTILLGPNGAGKSLLLRLFNGLLQPASGEILWDGAPLAPDHRRAQAMVPQRPVLLRRSVAGNLAFALSAQKLPRAERRSRVAEALDQARLSHLAKAPARRLSGGEQQRLALARALAARPSLLLLDEPTASLDPASTAAIEAQLAEARAAGCTLLLVTHDASQARRLGDRIAFLSAGRLVENGPLGPALANPQTPEFQAWLQGRVWAPPHPLP